MAKSELEEKFVRLFFDKCEQHNVAIPDPEREYQFHPIRKWRFDFAWPLRGVAVEIDGGSWVSGRHVNPIGLEKDFEKRNAATSMGWKILHYTGRQLDDADQVFEDLLFALGFFEEQASDS